MADQAISTSSGFTYTPYDVVIEDETQTLRLWLLSDDLNAEGFGFDVVIEEIYEICDAMVVALIAQNALTVDDIIIYMADREIPFGQSDPDATQYITAFSTDGATCTEELH